MRFSSAFFPRDPVACGATSKQAGKAAKSVTCFDPIGRFAVPGEVRTT
jgi:hypothetical protein